MAENVDDTLMLEILKEVRKEQNSQRTLLLQTSEAVRKLHQHTEENLPAIKREILNIEERMKAHKDDLELMLNLPRPVRCLRRLDILSPWPFLPELHADKHSSDRSPQANATQVIEYSSQCCRRSAARTGTATAVPSLLWPGRAKLHIMLADS